MKDRNVLFLGGIFPKEKEQEIYQKSKGALQSAANVLQWNFINGLDENLTTPLTILNAPFIGSFPKRYKDLFVKGYSFSHIEGANDYSVRFCNLSGFKRFSIARKLKKALKKWVKEKGENSVVFSYALTYNRLKAIRCAKKLDPTLKACLIVPDLPQYMNMTGKASIIYRVLKKLDWIRIKKNLKHVDCFVLLTKQMANFLNVENYVVVEGIARDVNQQQSAQPTSEKRIVYAGGLNLQYGIGDLVDSFKLIKGEEYRLILCGAGNAVEKIKNASIEDPRIEYKGLVPHSQAIQIVNSATVLVNPRKNNEEFTKYSFPSKTMEYMSTGVPVVAYKLDGIPNEYDEYLNYVEDDTLETLANKLVSICELSEQERIDIGKRARTFILENKNAKVQVERVLDYLSH